MQLFRFSSEVAVINESRSSLLTLPLVKVGSTNQIRWKITKSLQDFEKRVEVPTKTQSFHVIIGTITLVLGKYLLVAPKTVKVGEILGRPVFRILSCEAIPLFIEDGYDVTDSESLSLISDLVTTGGLYFSPTFNLTKSLQQQIVGGATLQTPKPEDLEERFFWNSSLSQGLLQDGAAEFVTPLIYGHFSQSPLVFNQQTYDFILVSRRHKSRAGLRYTRRGADLRGNAANYVETEQILISGSKKVSSFVQTRGSIPILWKQTVDLYYKPRLVIHAEVEENVRVMKLHLDQQIDLYGDQTLVSLISKRGFERTLRDSFSEAVTVLANERVAYVEFFVNEVCKGMKYHKMAELIDQLRPKLTQNGTFFWDSASTTEVQEVKLQQGVIRTNCLDCLDRTNLSQSLVALDVLPTQLHHLGGATQEELVKGLTFSDKFMWQFRNIWADNGDVISQQYAGTGALKADFTRTGKRRLRGGLNDGMNSLTRYYLNNFVDGQRQDALDLFLGLRKVAVVEQHKKEVLIQSRLWYVTVLVTTVKSFAPRRVNSHFQFVQALFWSIFMIFAWLVLNLDGRVLAVHPTLPDEVEIPQAQIKKRIKKEE